MSSAAAFSLGALTFDATYGNMVLSGFFLRQGEHGGHAARDGNAQKASERDFQKVAREIDEHAAADDLPEGKALTKVAVCDQRHIGNADGV